MHKCPKCGQSVSAELDAGSLGAAGDAGEGLDLEDQALDEVLGELDGVFGDQMLEKLLKGKKPDAMAIEITAAKPGEEAEDEELY